MKKYEPKDLPKNLPLLPLHGVTILPRMHFPVSMETPSEISMVDDAMRENRMIGIIQPKNTDARPPLYHVGTLVRITALEENDEGKYIIGVTGICRFRMNQELPTARDYRLGEVDYADFLNDLKLPDTYHFQRRVLLGQLRDFFDAAGIAIDWDAVSRTPDMLLVNSLAIICPFDVPEKQALLESQTVADRLQTLQAILTFANAAAPAALRVVH